MSAASCAAADPAVNRAAKATLRARARWRIEGRGAGMLLTILSSAVAAQTPDCALLGRRRAGARESGVARRLLEGFLDGGDHLRSVRRDRRAETGDHAAVSVGQELGEVPGDAAAGGGVGLLVGEELVERCLGGAFH